MPARPSAGASPGEPSSRDAHAAPVEASSYPLRLGSRAPDFALPGVDGKTHRLADFDARVLVVAFWCNHCPYVQAYEDRVIEYARAAAARDVAVVAISSNEVENYPEDDFPYMVERAQSKGYPFPYLRDEDQSVARAFGAQCTPHFLVFDAERRLRYQGRFDDSKDRPQAVTRRFLPDAVDDLLAGREVSTPETWAIGCSIKWDKL